MNNLIYFAVLFAFLLVSNLSTAHDVGLSTATIRIVSTEIQTTLGFALREVEQISPLDENHDGKVDRDEFEKGREKLVRSVMDECRLQVGGESLGPTDRWCRMNDADNVEISFLFEVPNMGDYSINFELIRHLIPGHRMFVSVFNSEGGLLDNQLLDAHSTTINVPLKGNPNIASKQSLTGPWGSFLVLGVEHIMTGYDHLLFLLGLLIVTQTLGSALSIITCFTLAHSITLALATFNLVDVPNRLVEPLIAASIVYVGLENLFSGGVPKGRWQLTLAFGLIHGFGFASVLREMGIGSKVDGVIMPLLFFNLGVELGQISLAGLTLPLIWMLRKQTVFVGRWVPACSICVIAAGGFWLMQRL
jgi:hydrogenase/urease accessory protein HupE